MLLEQGVDVDIASKNHQNIRPLHWAALRYVRVPRYICVCLVVQSLDSAEPKCTRRRCVPIDKCFPFVEGTRASQSFSSERARWLMPVTAKATQH